jgi:hypothetical protein
VCGREWYSIGEQLAALWPKAGERNMAEHEGGVSYQRVEAEYFEKGSIR